MARATSISRLAKTSGLDPYELAIAMMDRGIEVDDVDGEIAGATRKAAKAVAKELRGGPKVVRPKMRSQEETRIIEPARRSKALHGVLSVEDVLFIHERLCDDFAKSEDPIDPPGVRSMALLSSAVGRQDSGYEGVLKYHEPVINAATLLYGICNDHPFHNGNKRTALVAGLAHLDRNHLVLEATKQKDLFRLMIAVASHTLVTRQVKIGRETGQVPRRATPDEEVAAIADWFRPRVIKITRGEAQITYRELRQILGSFGYTIQPQKGLKVAVCAEEVRRVRLRKTRRPKAVMSLDWPGDGKTVSIENIKRVRRTLHLCEEDGVTREAFYSDGIRVDRFINDYRLVLRRLASR